MITKAWDIDDDGELHPVRTGPNTWETLHEIPPTIPPFLRTPYNYNMNAAGDESALDCSNDPTKTQQQFREEVDINTIVERFGLTGELPTNLKVPQSGDFEAVVDYQTALNQVIAAREAFMEMPAGIRARFKNNPQEFLEFCGNPENRAEAEKLGILVPTPKPPEPMAVRVVPDPQETPKTGVT